MASLLNRQGQRIFGSHGLIARSDDSFDKENLIKHSGSDCLKVVVFGNIAASASEPELQCFFTHDNAHYHARKDDRNMTTTQGFYDDLAEHYHLIFEDWSRSIERQAGILGPLLERYTGLSALRLLDCSCGIGTQALGLAQRGHTVVASDLSRASVARAQREARRLGVEVQFHVADMRELNSVPAEGFDVVLAADNALPHLLSEVDLSRAFEQMGSKLRRGGTLAATVRDYDQLIQTRPAMQPPAFFGAAGQRRIVHQVWDWDGTEYDLHLYISFETAVGWVYKHYISRYRALLRAEISASLERAGFTGVEWLEPQATSFYQPIVVARKEPS